MAMDTNPSKRRKTSHCEGSRVKQTANDCTSKRKTGFFDLPRELRDMVYDLVLQPQSLHVGPRRKRQSYYGCHGLKFPGIYQTNRQCREETIKFWLSRLELNFDFDCIDSLHGFLNIVGKDNAAAVRAIVDWSWWHNVYAARRNQTRLLDELHAKGFEISDGTLKNNYHKL